MCGFTMDLIFKVAIAIVVILVILALLRVAFGEFWTNITVPYWNVISIVIRGVIAIIILFFLWRLAECAGVVGRIGATSVSALSRLDFIAQMVL